MATEHMESESNYFQVARLLRFSKKEVLDLLSKAWRKNSKVISAVSSNFFRKKTVVQLGSLVGRCKSYPVWSSGEAPDNVGHFAFWIAQNIALVALRQRTLAKACTPEINTFESLESQTGISASKYLWIRGINEVYPFL